jgi:hypothetical protein
MPQVIKIHSVVSKKCKVSNDFHSLYSTHELCSNIQNYIFHDRRPEYNSPVAGNVSPSDDHHHVEWYPVEEMPETEQKLEDAGSSC